MSSIMTTTTTTTTTSPVAGWLTKMISLPFGRSRWISRFFVLLDSELRFYKDEHSDSASQILNLRKVYQVIPTPTTQHPFCFRLEPQQYTNDSVTRPWIIECKSQIEMENWISAIQLRINKYNNNSNNSSPSSSPKTPLNNNNNETTRIVSSYSMNTNTFPEFYRAATLPLRCTNLTLDNDDEIEEKEKESLLMRRKKKLAPIVTQQQQHKEQQQQEEVLYYSPPSTCSSLSLISPTGAVLGTLISPSIIDRYSQYKQQQQKDVTTHVTTTDMTQEDKRCESSSSPTYLMYKKKFHL